jgi:hypothetical protein
LLRCFFFCFESCVGSTGSAGFTASTGAGFFGSSTTGFLVVVLGFCEELLLLLVDLVVLDLVELDLLVVDFDDVLPLSITCPLGPSCQIILGSAEGAAGTWPGVRRRFSASRLSSMVGTGFSCWLSTVCACAGAMLRNSAEEIVSAPISVHFFVFSRKRCDMAIRTTQ